MLPRKALAFLSERRLRRMKYTERGRASELEQFSDESELDQADRHELDDAVLELLGIDEAPERESIREKIYEYLRGHYETVRQKEEAAILNKKRAKRASRMTPSEMADQVYKQLIGADAGLARTYQDFLTPSLVERSEGMRIPAKGRPEIVDDMITVGVRFATGRGKGTLVAARNQEQARLIALVAEAEGLNRHAFFPIAANDARRLCKQFERHVAARRKRVEELVEERTADFDLQEKIVDLVLARLAGTHG